MKDNQIKPDTKESFLKKVKVKLSNRKKTSQKPKDKKTKHSSFGSLSIKEQAFFAKRLAFLIKAGVPILESLHMIREQTRSRKYGRMLDHIIDDISNGQSLSTSLKKFHRLFGDFAINIISVGEETGILSENLEYLADELKKRQALRRKVVGALVYPVFITIATLGITGLLTAYIFPKIMPIFNSLNVHLPLSTRILIFMSQFLRDWGIFLILGLLALVIATVIAHRKSKKVHYFFDSLILKTPLVGSMIQNYNLANISRTLSLLLKGGMTLSEAIPITARSTSNLVYRSEFEKLAVVVNRGEKISSHLRKYRKLFPDILAQIVSVGERSGNLSETLVYLSELYESEVEDSTKNLSSLIEPVLMVFMGLIVGFVAISVITPIYGITQHLQPR
jgi:type IV pilus assembly protein PilC